MKLTRRKAIFCYYLKEYPQKYHFE